MALSPEEARQKAIDGANGAAEEKVAIFLKQQFGNLTIIPEYKDLAVPTEDGEYRTMAKQLINERAFSAKTKNGEDVIVSLKDLDAQVDRYQPEIKASQGINSLEELVPTREQLDATGDAIGNGVKEHTGGIGFLGGATIMNTIKGFFSWMFSGFKGGFAGLKEAIASVTAENMQESVANNLVELREKYPSMNRFLTDETIQNIGGEVNGRVMQEAGFAAPESADNRRPVETLENAQPVTPDGNKLAENRIKIREGILNPENGPALAEVIAGQYSDATQTNDKSRGWYNPLGWVDAGVVTSEQALPTGTAMADTIATTVSAAVTDPNFKTRYGKRLADIDNKGEFIDALTEEVGKGMLKDEKKYGLPVSLSDTSPTDPNKTILDTFKDQIREKLSAESTDGSASAYERLSMAARYTAQASNIPSTARELADNAGADARNAGMSGASEHDANAPPNPGNQTIAKAEPPKFRGGFGNLDAR